MNKTRFLGLAIFPVLLFAAVGGVAVIGCGGSDPSFAPFGSEVEILTEDIEVAFGPEGMFDERVQAIVTGPEGQPLNDVRVIWDLAFAGINDRVIDTNGDGVADARALQLVNPQACGDVDCRLVDVSLWFQLGAFVDSPFETLTDDRGLADVIILINGQIIAAEATLQASTDSGSVDTVDIDFNQ